MKRNLSLCFSLLCSLLFTINKLQAQTGHDVAYYVKNAPFAMPALTAPQFAAKVFNVMDYGAVADGQTLNTDAFAKAIDACSQAGGGMVLVPPGLYFTGPIALKSNVNFHTDRGALVIFSPVHALYITDGRAISPLSGYKLENVAITGEGIYDGAGDAWRPLKKSKAAPTLWADLLKAGGTLTDDGNMLWPAPQADEANNKKYYAELEKERPVLVSLQTCKNVLVDGPTFKNSPKFAFCPKNCTNLIVHNVHVNNEYYAQNGDAMDISACKNVIVYGCTINAGDDGICMKSTGFKGQGVSALENVIIADNIVYHAHGGFVVGSNTDGGMNNIWVTNCNFVNTDIGIRIKSDRGRGGVVQNFYIDHIYMRDILNEAILFSSYYGDDEKSGGADEVGKPLTDKTPQFTHFYLSNIYCNHARNAVSIVGLPEMPVNHISFTDITISADNGFKATQASDIDIKNLRIVSPAEVVYSLNNAWNFNITKPAYSNNAALFLTAKGAKTQAININQSGLTNPENAIKLADGVNKATVLVDGKGL